MKKAGCSITSHVVHVKAQQEGVGNGRPEAMLFLAYFVDTIWTMKSVACSWMTTHRKNPDVYGYMYAI